VNTDLINEPGASRRVLSVSQLNQRARQLLETHFSQVWVEGEVSNLVKPSSGHWYFTLKDAGAQVRCAMFRNRNQLLRFPVSNGSKVTARGRLSLYENRGDYQLIVENLEPSGIGALQRAFEQLKQQLSARGWFDPEHKQPLPDLPRHIGVITSPSGAAIRDILVTLRRRFPSIPVTIFPTPVQGSGAGTQIAAAIDTANRIGSSLQPPLDVLIVGRGGGSLEDLWAFNEEVVASAIYHSQLPIVSAVGHEIDFSIADLVADQRAATPTAAAELLSPDQRQWLDAIAQRSRRLDNLLRNNIQLRQGQLDALQRRLKHPGARLQEFSQRLDDLELRLVRSHRRILSQQHARLEQLGQRMLVSSPQDRIDRQRDRLQGLQQQLLRQWRQNLHNKQQSLAKHSDLLHSVSPLQTLQRGYAIIVNADGAIVKSVRELNKTDRIHIRMSDGDVDASIL
jgi:exodeoxyribonuclease VII large subunit